MKKIAICDNLYLIRKKINEVAFLSLMLSILSFNIIGCKSFKNANKIENATLLENHALLRKDSLILDTVYLINEKYCFPKESICLDSFVYVKDSLASNTLPEFYYSYEFTWINLDRNINIYPAILGIDNNTVILRKFINMLNTQNKILDADYERYRKTNKDYRDSFSVETSYYFDYRIQNNIHIIDTLHYNYWSNSTVVNGPINLELDLEILGEDNLNYLKVVHSKLLFEDHVTHEYSSVNQNCKNFIFKLKFTTYNKDLMGAEYYLPWIWTFCEKG